MAKKKSAKKTRRRTTRRSVRKKAKRATANRPLTTIQWSGFDTGSYPGDMAISAWASKSPYRFVGYLSRRALPHDQYLQDVEGDLPASQGVRPRTRDRLRWLAARWMRSGKIVAREGDRARPGYGHEIRCRRIPKGRRRLSRRGALQRGVVGSHGGLHPRVDQRDPRQRQGDEQASTAPRARRTRSRPLRRKNTPRMDYRAGRRCFGRSRPIRNSITRPRPPRVVECRPPRCGRAASTSTRHMAGSPSRSIRT